MATIRVRDWTKERIEEIRESESHSSHDSVIKSLLKDRKLAQFAGTAVEGADESPEEEAADEATDGPFADLTVLAELPSVDNGVVFLWCPNCPNEVAHVGFDGPASISALELNCQRCLTRLDEHAIVEIDVGYPLEERVVEGTLHDDLRACVIDYWDRALERAETGDAGTAGGDVDDVDADGLVRTIDGYLREFGWEWPADVPAVALQTGYTYRNEETGELLDVLDPASEDGEALDAYRVRITPADAATGDDDGPADAGRPDADYPDAETTVLDAPAITSLVLGRRLTIVDRPDGAGPPAETAAESADASGSSTE